MLSLQPGRHMIYFRNRMTSCQYRRDTRNVDQKQNIFGQKQPPEVSCKNCVLRNFAKFTGKHLRQSLFFNKVAGFSPATLFKKRLSNRCFPVNFAKFLKTPILQNASGRLFLSVKLCFQKSL